MLVNPEILAVKKLKKEDPSYTVRPSSSKPKQTKEMKLCDAKIPVLGILQLT